MSGFDPNALANATAPTGEYGDNPPPPPVGTYDVVVQNAEAFSTESKGDFVKIELSVATGGQVGYGWTELFGFKTQKAYDYFKGVCERIGVDLDGVTGLEVLNTRVKGVIGNWYAVDVVASRNPQFPKNSVFFKDGGPITASASTAASSTTPVGSVPADDDIPF